MGESPEMFSEIDKNVAANLRVYRETRGVSQEELAQRMTDRGFGFSQATIWKIEQGKRPVKIGEVVALARALGLIRWADLTLDPVEANYQARLEQAHRDAADSYRQLKVATTAYLEAQIEVAIAVREARDAGVSVRSLWTTWLKTPPERAVLEARIEEQEHDAMLERIDDAVGQIIEALHDRGFETILDPAAIEHGGGPLHPDDGPHGESTETGARTTSPSTEHRPDKIKS